MKVLFPLFCLFAHMAFMSHIAIIAYRLSGSPEAKVFEAGLDKYQKQVYDEIKNERRRHYTLGMLIGAIISVAFILLSKAETGTRALCAYVGLTTFVANQFYLLMPKSKYMIEYLSDKKDIVAHHNIYKKFRYMTSYADFLGVVIFIIGQLS